MNPFLRSKVFICLCVYMPTQMYTEKAYTSYTGLQILPRWAVQNTHNCKSWNSLFFPLHFGSEKPITTLHILLKDTTVPTIYPAIRIRDSSTGQKEALKKPPPILPTSRNKEEEEKKISAWVEHNLQVTCSDFALIFGIAIPALQLLSTSRI